MVISIFKNLKPLKVESVCAPGVERSARQKLQELLTQKNPELLQHPSTNAET